MVDPPVTSGRQETANSKAERVGHVAQVCKPAGNCSRSDGQSRFSLAWRIHLAQVPIRTARIGSGQPAESAADMQRASSVPDPTRGPEVSVGKVLLYILPIGGAITMAIYGVAIVYGLAVGAWHLLVLTTKGLRTLLVEGAVRFRRWAIRKVRGRPRPSSPQPG